MNPKGLKQNILFKSIAAIIAFSMVFNNLAIADTSNSVTSTLAPQLLISDVAKQTLFEVSQVCATIEKRANYGVDTVQLDDLKKWSNLRHSEEEFKRVIFLDHDKEVHLVVDNKYLIRYFNPSDPSLEFLFSEDIPSRTLISESVITPSLKREVYQLTPALPPGRSPEDVFGHIINKAGLDGVVNVTRQVFPVGEDQYPVCALTPGGDLMIHPEFAMDFDDIRSSGIGFNYTFKDGQTRWIDLADAIAYRVAMHEFDLPGREGHGHGYLDDEGKFKLSRDEKLANYVGRRYSVVDDAMWLWYLHSYKIADEVRYDNRNFKERIRWLFYGESDDAVALREEFPLLAGDEDKRKEAIRLALLINKAFFQERKTIGIDPTPRYEKEEPAAGEEMADIKGSVFATRESQEYEKERLSRKIRDAYAAVLGGEEKVEVGNCELLVDMERGTLAKAFPMPGEERTMRVRISLGTGSNLKEIALTVTKDEEGRIQLVFDYVREYWGKKMQGQAILTWDNMEKIFKRSKRSKRPGRPTILPQEKEVLISEIRKAYDEIAAGKEKVEIGNCEALLGLRTGLLSDKFPQPDGGITGEKMMIGAGTFLKSADLTVKRNEEGSIQLVFNYIKKGATEVKTAILIWDEKNMAFLKPQDVLISEIRRAYDAVKKGEKEIEIGDCELLVNMSSGLLLSNFPAPDGEKTGVRMAIGTGTDLKNISLTVATDEQGSVQLVFKYERKHEKKGRKKTGTAILTWGDEERTFKGPARLEGKAPRRPAGSGRRTSKKRSAGSGRKVFWGSQAALISKIRKAYDDVKEGKEKVEIGACEPVMNMRQGALLRAFPAPDGGSVSELIAIGSGWNLEEISLTVTTDEKGSIKLVFDYAREVRKEKLKGQAILIWDEGEKTFKKPEGPRDELISKIEKAYDVVKTGRKEAKIGDCSLLVNMSSGVLHKVFPAPDGGTIGKAQAIGCGYNPGKITLTVTTNEQGSIQLVFKYTATGRKKTGMAILTWNEAERTFQAPHEILVLKIREAYDGVKAGKEKVVVGNCDVLMNMKSGALQMSFPTPDGGTLGRLRSIGAGLNLKSAELTVLRNEQGIIQLNLDYVKKGGKEEGLSGSVILTWDEEKRTFQTTQDVLGEKIKRAYAAVKTGAEEVEIGDCEAFMNLDGGRLFDSFPAPDGKRIGKAIAIGSGSNLKKAELTVTRNEEGKIQLVIDYERTKRKKTEKGRAVLTWNEKERDFQLPKDVLISRIKEAYAAAAVIGEEKKVEIGDCEDLMDMGRGMIAGSCPTPDGGTIGQIKGIGSGPGLEKVKLTVTQDEQGATQLIFDYVRKGDEGEEIKGQAVLIWNEKEKEFQALQTSQEILIHKIKEAYKAVMAGEEKVDVGDCEPLVRMRNGVLRENFPAPDGKVIGRRQPIGSGIDLEKIELTVTTTVTADEETRIRLIFSYEKKDGTKGQADLVWDESAKTIKKPGIDARADKLQRERKNQLALKIEDAYTAVTAGEEEVEVGNCELLINMERGLLFNSFPTPDGGTIGELKSFGAGKNLEKTDLTVTRDEDGAIQLVFSYVHHVRKGRPAKRVRVSGSAILTWNEEDRVFYKPGEERVQEKLKIKEQQNLLSQRIRDAYEEVTAERGKRVEIPDCEPLVDMAGGALHRAFPTPDGGTLKNRKAIGSGRDLIKADLVVTTDKQGAIQLIVAYVKKTGKGEEISGLAVLAWNEEKKTFDRPGVTFRRGKEWEAKKGALIKKIREAYTDVMAGKEKVQIGNCELLVYMKGGVLLKIFPTPDGENLGEKGQIGSGFNLKEIELTVTTDEEGAIKLVFDYVKEGAEGEIQGQSVLVWNEGEGGFQHPETAQDVLVSKIREAYSAVMSGEKEEVKIGDCEPLMYMKGGRMPMTFPTPDGGTLGEQKPVGSGYGLKKIELTINQNEEGSIQLILDYVRKLDGKDILGQAILVWDGEERTFLMPQGVLASKIRKAYDSVKAGKEERVEIGDCGLLVNKDRGKMLSAFPSPDGGSIRKVKSLGTGLSLQEIELTVSKNEEGMIQLVFDYVKRNDTEEGEKGQVILTWNEKERTFELPGEDAEAKRIQKEQKELLIQRIRNAYAEIESWRRREVEIGDCEPLVEMSGGKLLRSFPTPDGENLEKGKGMGTGYDLEKVGLTVTRNEKDVIQLAIDYERQDKDEDKRQGRVVLTWDEETRTFLTPVEVLISEIREAYTAVTSGEEEKVEIGDCTMLVNMRTGQLGGLFPTPDGGRLGKPKAIGLGWDPKKVDLTVTTNEAGLIQLVFECEKIYRGETITIKATLVWTGEDFLGLETPSRRARPRTDYEKAVGLFKRNEILDLAVILSGNPEEMKQVASILLFQRGERITESDLSRLTRAFLLNLREGMRPGSSGIQPGDGFAYLRALMGLQDILGELDKYEQLVLIRAFERMTFSLFARDYDTALEQMDEMLKHVSMTPFLKEIREQVTTMFGEGLKYQPAHIKTRLYPHQRVGAWLMRNSQKYQEDGIFGFMLEDDTRLGKTIQAYAAMDPSWKVCIAVPAGVMDTWLEQYYEHTTGEMEMVFLRGSVEKKKRLIEESRNKKGVIILTSIEDMRGRTHKEMEAINSGLDLVIVDEGQRIENYWGAELRMGSLQARAMHQLRASRKWMLSASPYTSHPSQLFSSFNYIHTDPVTGEVTSPLYATRRGFEGTLAERGMEGMKWLYALKARIGLRRTKKELGILFSGKNEIPPEQEGNYTITPEQARLTLKIIKNLGEYLKIYNEQVPPEERYTESSIGLFLKLQVLSWALTDPTMLGEDIPTIYWDAMDDLVLGRLEADRKGIIYAQNTAMIDKIIQRYSDKGYKVARIDGTVQGYATDKDGNLIRVRFQDGKMVEDPEGEPVSAKAYQRYLFQRDPEVKLVVMNVRAGLGLDLSAADWELYAQLPQHYVEYYQSSDRALGPNPYIDEEQQKKVEVLFMMPKYPPEFIEEMSGTPDRIYVSQGTPAEILFSGIMGPDRMKFEMVMEGLEAGSEITEDMAQRRLVQSIYGFLEDPSMVRATRKERRQIQASNVFYETYRKYKGDRELEEQVLLLVNAYAMANISPERLVDEVISDERFAPEDLRMLNAVFDIPTKRQRDYILEILPDIYAKIWKKELTGISELAERGPPVLRHLAESQPELFIPFLAVTHFWDSLPNEEEVLQPENEGATALIHILEEFYEDSLSEYDRHQLAKRYIYTLLNLIDLDKDELLDFLSFFSEDILDESMSVDAKIEFLEKLGILRQADRERYKGIILARASFEAIKGSLDKAMEETFVRFFELEDTDDTRRGLIRLAQEWGNLNAPILLMSRLLSGDQSVYGEHVELMRLVMKHIVNGTYTRWRNEQAMDLSGHEITYREEDTEFWKAFNREEEVRLGSVKVMPRKLREIKSHRIEELAAMLEDGSALEEMFGERGTVIYNDITSPGSEREIDAAIREKGREMNRLSKAERTEEVAEAINKLKQELNELWLRSNLASLHESLKNEDEPGMQRFLRRVRGNCKALPDKPDVEALIAVINEIEAAVEVSKRSIDFNDVEVQITSDSDLIMRRGMLNEEMKNCFNLNAGVRQIATLVDDLAARNKMLAVVRMGGRVASVAVLKVRQAEDGEPVIMIEKPLYRWIYDFEREIAQAIAITKPELEDAAIAGYWSRAEEHQVKLFTTGARGPTEYHEGLFGVREREEEVYHVARFLMKARKDITPGDEDREGITRIKVDAETGTKDLIGLGHGNRSQAEFITLLKRSGVRSLVDIRSRPASRPHPHFNQEILRETLAAHGIDYVWLGDILGGSLPEYKDDFTEYMKEDPDGKFTRGISELQNIINGTEGTVAVCCSETLPRHCHRGVILEYLEQKFMPTGEIAGDMKNMLSGMGIAEDISEEVTRALKETGRAYLRMPYGFVTLSKDVIDQYSRLIGRVNGEEIYATRTETSVTYKYIEVPEIDHNLLTYTGHEIMDTLWQMAHEGREGLEAQDIRKTLHWQAIRGALVDNIGEANAKLLESLLPVIWVVSRGSMIIPWDAAHASWRGIHLGMKISYTRMAEMLVHELGAYYGKTHDFNRAFEQAFNNRDIQEWRKLAKQLNPADIIKHRETITAEGEKRDFAAQEDEKEGLIQKIREAYTAVKAGEEKVEIGNCELLIYMKKGSLSKIFPAPDKDDIGGEKGIGSGGNLEEIELTVVRNEEGAIQLEFDYVRKGGKSDKGKDVTGRAVLIWDMVKMKFEPPQESLISRIEEAYTALMSGVKDKVVIGGCESVIGMGVGVLGKKFPTPYGKLMSERKGIGSGGGIKKIELTIALNEEGAIQLGLDYVRKGGKRDRGKDVTGRAILIWNDEKGIFETPQEVLSTKIKKAYTAVKAEKTVKVGACESLMSMDDGDLFGVFPTPDGRTVGKPWKIGSGKNLKKAELRIVLNEEGAIQLKFDYVKREGKGDKEKEVTGQAILSWNNEKKIFETPQDILIAKVKEAYAALETGKAVEVGDCRSLMNMDKGELWGSFPAPDGSTIGRHKAVGSGGNLTKIGLAVTLNKESAIQLEFNYVRKEGKGDKGKEVTGQAILTWDGKKTFRTPQEVLIAKIEQAYAAVESGEEKKVKIGDAEPLISFKDGRFSKSFPRPDGGTIGRERAIGSGRNLKKAELTVARDKEGKIQMVVDYVKKIYRKDKVEEVAGRALFTWDKDSKIFNLDKKSSYKQTGKQLLTRSIREAYTAVMSDEKERVEVGNCEFLMNMEGGVLYKSFPTPDGGTIGKQQILGSGGNLKEAELTVARSEEGTIRLGFDYVKKRGKGDKEKEVTGQAILAWNDEKRTFEKPGKPTPQEVLIDKIRKAYVAVRSKEKKEVKIGGCEPLVNLEWGRLMRNFPRPDQGDIGGEEPIGTGLALEEAELTVRGDEEGKIHLVFDYVKKRKERAKKAETGQAILIWNDEKGTFETPQEDLISKIEKAYAALISGKAKEVEVGNCELLVVMEYGVLSTRFPAPVGGDIGKSQRFGAGLRIKKIGLKIRRSEEGKIQLGFDYVRKGGKRDSGKDVAGQATLAWNDEKELFETPQEGAISEMEEAYSMLKAEKEAEVKIRNGAPLINLGKGKLFTVFPTPDGKKIGGHGKSIGSGTGLAEAELLVRRNEEGKIQLVFDYVKRIKKKEKRAGTGRAILTWNEKKRIFETPQEVLISKIEDAYDALQEEKAKEVKVGNCEPLMLKKYGQLYHNFPTPDGGRIGKGQRIGSEDLKEVELTVTTNEAGQIQLVFDCLKISEGEEVIFKAILVWNGETFELVIAPRRPLTDYKKAVELFDRYSLLDMAVILSSNPQEMREVLAILLTQMDGGITQEEFERLSKALILNLREGQRPQPLGPGIKPGDGFSYLRVLMALQEIIQRLNEYEQLVLMRAFERMTFPLFARDYASALKEMDKLLEGVPMTPFLTGLKNQVETMFGEGLKYQPGHIKTQLYPHQRVGAWYMKNSQKYQEDGIFGFMLEDDTRLGKTIQTFAAMDPSWKVCIAVPAGIMDTWREQYYEHTTGEMELVFLRGSVEKKRRLIEESRNKKGVIILTSIEDMRGRTDEEMEEINNGLDLVVVDEAQRIENYGGLEVKTSSLQAKAIQRLRASHKWILSASPYTSHPRQLFSAFHYIHKHPETDEITNPLYATRRGFSRLLARRGIEGLKWLYALKARIGLRRTKPELGILFSDKKEVAPAEEGSYTITPEQSRLTLRIIKNLKDYLKRHNANVPPEDRYTEESMGVFLKLQFLSWAATDPTMLGEDMPTTYWDSMDDIVEKRVKANKKGIIYAQNTAIIDKMIDRYQKKGYKVARIDGTVRGYAKDEAGNLIRVKFEEGKMVEDPEGEPISAKAYQRYLFQKDPEVKLVVMNVRAGLGLDLSAADWELYAQLPQHYVEYYQSSDRALGPNPYIDEERQKKVEVLCMVPKYPKEFIEEMSGTDDRIYVDQGTPGEILYSGIMGEDRMTFNMVMEGIESADKINGDRSIRRLVQSIYGFLEDPSMRRAGRRERKQIAVSNIFYRVYSKFRKDPEVEEQVLTLMDAYIRADVSPSRLAQVIAGRKDFDPRDFKLINAVFNIPTKRQRDYMLEILPDIYDRIWKKGHTGISELAERGPPVLFDLADTLPELFIPFIAVTQFWNSTPDDEEVLQPDNDGASTLIQILEEFYEDSLSDYDRQQLAKRYIYTLLNLIDLDRGDLLDLLAFLREDILDEGVSVEDNIEFLEKLGILRQADFERYEEVVHSREPFGSIKDVLDSAMRETFIQLFELEDTERTRRGLTRLAGEWGNLTAPVQLITQLLSGDQAEYREHVSLMRLIMKHIVNGTYEEWRNKQSMDHTGHEVTYRREDTKFWEAFNREERVKLGKVVVRPRTLQEIRAKRIDELMTMLGDRSALEEMFGQRGTTIYNDMIFSGFKETIDAQIREKGKEMGRLSKEKKTKEVEGAVNKLGQELSELRLRADLIDLHEALKQESDKDMLRLLRRVRGICQNLPDKPDVEALITVLNGLESALEGGKKSLNFENVEVQITSDPDLIMRRGMLNEEMKNCFNLNAGVRQVATLVDDLAARNKMLAVVRVEGRIASVAMLKVRRTKENEAVIMIENPLYRWGYDFEREIAQAIGITKLPEMEDAAVAGQYTKSKEDQIYLHTTGARGPTEYFEGLFGVRKREREVYHVARMIMKAGRDITQEDEEGQGLTRIKVDTGAGIKDVVGLGHGVRSEAAFITLLKRAGIKCLVDIRSRPGSRYYPHFNQEVFRETLAGHGIEYVWLGDVLGGLLPEYRDDFQKYMKADPDGKFTGGIAGLQNIINGTKGTVGICCSETKPDDCHRRFILDHLKKNFTPTGDIAGDMKSMLSGMGIAEDISAEVSRALEEKGLAQLRMPYGVVALSKDALDQQSRLIGRINGEDIYATRTETSRAVKYIEIPEIDHNLLAYAGHEIMDTLWQMAHEGREGLEVQEMKKTLHWQAIRGVLVGNIGEGNTKLLESLLPSTWIVSTGGMVIPWDVGHASWRGIHLALKISYTRMAGMLVHELGAYYGKTHDFNKAFERAFRNRDIQEWRELAKQLNPANIIKHREIITAEGEKRDFAEQWGWGIPRKETVIQKIREAYEIVKAKGGRVDIEDYGLLVKKKSKKLSANFPTPDGGELGALKYINIGSNVKTAKLAVIRNEAGQIQLVIEGERVVHKKTLSYQTNLVWDGKTFIESGSSKWEEIDVEEEKRQLAAMKEAEEEQRKKLILEIQRAYAEVMYEEDEDIYEDDGYEDQISVHIDECDALIDQTNGKLKKGFPLPNGKVTAEDIDIGLWPSPNNVKFTITKKGESLMIIIDHRSKRKTPDRSSKTRTNVGRKTVLTWNGNEFVNGEMEIREAYKEVMSEEGRKSISIESNLDNIIAWDYGHLKAAFPTPIEGGRLDKVVPIISGIRTHISKPVIRNKKGYIQVVFKFEKSEKRILKSGEPIDDSVEQEPFGKRNYKFEKKTGEVILTWDGAAFNRNVIFDAYDAKGKMPVYATALANLRKAGPFTPGYHETGAVLRSAVNDFVDSNLEFLGSMNGDNRSPVLVRVPVEVLQAVGKENAEAFLSTLDKFQNLYIELYAFSSQFEVTGETYKEYGITEKHFPQPMNRTNTLTLFARSKDEEIKSAIDLMEKIGGELYLNPSNTILMPVGLYNNGNDLSGLVRSSVLGLRLIKIARDAKRGVKDAAFIEETVVKFKKLCEMSVNEDFDMTAEDFIDIATGNINKVIAALNKLLKLLPITPIDTEELRAIYEHARKVLRAA